MNEQRLNQIARKVNADKAHKQLKEKEEKERLEREELEAEVARRIKDWPPFIEKEIEETAGKGEFYYEYDCGPDCDERVIRELLTQFVSLSPSALRVKKSRIVRYDPPVDEEYWTTVVTFRW